MAGQTPGTAGSGIKKVFSTALDETADYDKEGVGAIRFEGNSVYKWVKYTTGAGSVAAAANNVAYYQKAADSGYENHTVTSDVSDSDNLGAGVLQAAPANNEYCWIQIRGFATLNTSLTAGSDGNALTPVGAGDGTLDVSALVTDHVCAYAVDASADEIICDFPF